MVGIAVAVVVIVVVVALAITFWSMLAVSKREEDK